MWTNFLGVFGVFLITLGCFSMITAFVPVWQPAWRKELEPDYSNAIGFVIWGGIIFFIGSVFLSIPVAMFGFVGFFQSIFWESLGCFVFVGTLTLFYAVKVEASALWLLDLLDPHAIFDRDLVRPEVQIVAISVTASFVLMVTSALARLA